MQIRFFTGRGKPLRAYFPKAQLVSQGETSIVMCHSRGFKIFRENNYSYRFTRECILGFEKVVRYL